MSINFVTGDATNPKKQESKTSLILHVCNDSGGWGAGFTKAISKRWKEPEEVYQSLRLKYGDRTALGALQVIQVEDDVYVVNMIAQHTYGKHCRDSSCISYAALKLCLQSVSSHFDPKKFTIHMPRIGAGLAGGDWGTIETIIRSYLNDFEVTVYSLQ